jgi:hypothetical protein
MSDLNVGTQAVGEPRLLDLQVRAEKLNFLSNGSHRPQRARKNVTEYLSEKQNHRLGPARVRGD